LYFLIDVEEWKAQYHDVTPSARYARARHICKAYIIPSAIYSINIPGDISETLLGHFAKGARDVEAEKDVDRGLFDDAEDEIKQLLANGACLRFCNSSRYQAIAKETQDRIGNRTGSSVLHVVSASLAAWVGGGVQSTNSSSQLDSAGSMGEPIPTSPKPSVTKHHL
jgi:hypothetical protein